MKGKIYVRLSRDEVGQTSTADQERECRALAARLGTTDIEVFGEEPGTSGFKDVARPVFDRLMTTLEAGDLVLAWALDRVTRRGMEQAGSILRILEERGARLVTVSDGIDTAMDHSEINTGIRAIMAKEYSKGISRNVKRGKATGAALGHWNGGSRWFGYAGDAHGVWRGPVAIDEQEAAVLREMRRRYVAGDPLRHIVADLNERGTRTPAGSPLRSENMLRLMLNKRYAGVRVHNGAEYDGDWPPIFTAEEHAELEVARRSEQRMKHWPKGPTGARTYLLTGFVECGRCGKPMKGGRKKCRNKVSRRYVCHESAGGCGKLYRIADPVEALVTAFIMYRLDTPELARTIAAAEDHSDFSTLIARQEKIQLRLGELHHDYYDPDSDMRLDRREFMKLKSDLEGKLLNVERGIADAVNKRIHVRLSAGQTMQQAWDSGDIQWRRGLVALLIERIVIKPGNPGHSFWYGWKFDPDKIEIVWR